MSETHSLNLDKYAALKMKKMFVDAMFVIVLFDYQVKFVMLIHIKYFSLHRSLAGISALAAQQQKNCYNFEYRDDFCACHSGIECLVGT